MTHYEYARYLENPDEPSRIINDPAKCCMCHDTTERDNTLTIDGNIVCNDCLEDYCERHVSDYAEDFALENMTEFMEFVRENHNE